MNINFEWMGLDCVADYELDDDCGFVVSTVNIGDQGFMLSDAQYDVIDEIYALIEKAIENSKIDYNDNTTFFGEQI